MNFLRHPPLLGWLAIVIAGAGLIGVATTEGSDKSALPEAQQVLGPPAPNKSEAADNVTAMRNLAASGIAAGNDLTTLHTWAQQMHEIAREAVDERDAEGAKEDEAFRSSLADISASAKQLSETNDKTSARSGRTHVLLGIDRATAARAGYAAPSVPGPATKPLDVEVPEAPVVGVPDAPTSPKPNWSITTPELNKIETEPLPEKLGNNRLPDKIGNTELPTKLNTNKLPEKLTPPGESQ